MRQVPFIIGVSQLLLFVGIARAQDNPPASDGGTTPATAAPSATTPPPASPAPAATPSSPATSPPAATATPPSSPPSSRGAAQAARLQALEQQVKLLSEALATEKEEREKAAAAAPPPPPPPQAVPDPLHGIVISSYVQAQYESHEDSEDQVRQGGTLLNQDRFLIRRGRLKIQREWEYSSLMMELDGNTTKGPALLLHHAEASVLYRGNNTAPGPPMVQLTMGLFDVPFGDELVESPRTRFFMERSLASRAFFPAEPDLGIRIAGRLGWFRYALAAVNGEPNGVTDGFPLQDPNSGKDLIAKLGGLVEPSSTLEISGDVSFLNGKGFARGTDTTKGSLVWQDLNEDGTVRVTNEVVGLAGVTGLPSKNFDRWAVGADLRIRLKSDLGWGQLFGELTLANNLDRGLYVADPTLTGDAREFGYSIGLVQEITPYAVAGLRTDFYNPSADVTDQRLGKLLPKTATIRTYSPLVGAVLPGHLRLLFQYDFIKDHMARDALGVPTDMKNDTWTLRMQGEL